MIITESKISSIVAMITLIGMSLNTVAVIPKVNAASFRTKYKIYGDLNGDNMIDVFDVISMRNKVAKGSDDKSLDFNCDGTIDSKVKCYTERAVDKHPKIW